MAIIENISNGDKIVLHSHHTFGRDINNLNVINSKVVSRKHAALFWENNLWKLADFSKNGTLINNHRLHCSTVILKEKDIINFSAGNESAWRVLSLNKPSSYFKSVFKNNEYIELERSGVDNIVRGSFLFIKNRLHKWVIDNGVDEIVLEHGKKYQLGDNEYEYVENGCMSETVQNIKLFNKAKLLINISDDEESVSAVIRINKFDINLGSRSYNHLLLHLAREKQHDIDYGVRIEEAGWTTVESAANALGKELLLDIDKFYINNLVFRLRKQLMNLPPYGSQFIDIIERKSKKLRLGISNFKINKERIYNVV